MKKVAGVIFLVLGFIGSIAIGWYAYFLVKEHLINSWFYGALGAVCAWSITITLVGYAGRLFGIDVYGSKKKKDTEQ